MAPRAAAALPNTVVVAEAGSIVPPSGTATRGRDAVVAVLVATDTNDVPACLESLKATRDAHPDDLA